MNAEFPVSSRSLAKREELAGLIARFARTDGTHAACFPPLSLIRASGETAPFHTVYEPSICLVAQGSKLVLLADETYRYGPSQYFAVSVDLPISGRIIEASAERPYLAVRLRIEPQQILELMSEADKSGASGMSRTPSARGIYVNSAGEELLDAFLRLLRMLETPEDLPVLAPMAAREILYRAMRGDQGQALRQMAPGAGRAALVAEVIRRIRETYNEPLRIGELAEEAGMSPSSLHRHFRDVTAMSPLQFQKQLRLQEARRMLLTEPVQAAEAAFRVGYESPSQFNREYARLFGMPPLSDIRRLKSLPPEEWAGEA
ncbi:AraC family transcriptional regulator [Saccharibacillus alkalitolerans]|uniref:AraC family transcriptional regulator n=1 Tax=Saccharibacillus alkalitolerans TaxID=2705290 RepID=A0ABX0F1H4_9BACL|nr:AraC family transcriptional regulator [Saccharibacillus alkalitolerans]NGZ73774.1 AraC family transcriptional regulator [Saccharibacillus alkalitolerans]